MAKRQDLELQVSQLEARVNEMGGKLEEYRYKEQAIVNALTQAQAAAAKSIADAQVQAKAIIAEAEAQRILVNAQTDSIIQDAQKRADEIICAAKLEAAALIVNTQETVKSMDTQLASLNEALRNTAAQARIQAETFANAIEALKMGQANAAAAPSQAPDEHAGDAAANSAYTSPNELMRGIYQLQGREIPDDVLSMKPEPNEGKPPLEQQPVEHAKEDESALPPFDPVESQAKAQPQPEQAAPLQTEAGIMPAGATPIGITPVDIMPGKNEEAEARIWTVDEVMHAAAPAEPVQSMPSLDNLLDEIINEPKAKTRPQPPADQSGNVDLDGLLDEILGE